jgi:hypothetical protein
MRSIKIANRLAWKKPKSTGPLDAAAGMIVGRAERGEVGSFVID